MSRSPKLIPDEWAIHVAAFRLGVSITEAQALVDDGTIDLADAQSVEREAIRRELEAIQGLMGTALAPSRRTRLRARRS